MRKACRLVIPVTMLALLAGCGASELAKRAPEKTAESVPPPEPVSAQWAFRQMYLAARNWAADAEPLRLSTISLPEFRSVMGKADAWQATFVSLMKGRVRTFTYAVKEGPGNLHQGVFQGPEESWSGRDAQPFHILAFKVDATAALETALKHAADYARKHPQMPVNFLLERSPRFPNPVWRVIWGESAGTSGFSILIDATTGGYLQTLH